MMFEKNMIASRVNMMRKLRNSLTPEVAVRWYSVYLLRSFLTGNT